MTYYVVRVKTPNQIYQSLIFVLDKRQNLMEQVITKVGDQFQIISIRVLGGDWC